MRLLDGNGDQAEREKGSAGGRKEKQVGRKRNI